jgi:hypothetical protein
MKIKEKNKEKIINDNRKSAVINKTIFQKYIFYILILSQLGTIYCDDDKSKEIQKIILLFFLFLIILIIIILLIIFIIKCCKKKNEENVNNYLDGTNYLERGNTEELQIRHNYTTYGAKSLSNYLKEKLISEIYTKKFELFGNKCPICLESYEENKSVIMIGGCLHIFHQKCLGEFAEKIDINKPIFSQFICPSCRKNLFDDIDKIKICIKKDPNFFNDIYKNKKLTKIKHIKDLINAMLNENKNEKNTVFDSCAKINEHNNETNFKDEYKDNYYNNKNIDKEKLNPKTDEEKEIKNDEGI